MSHSQMKSIIKLENLSFETGIHSRLSRVTLEIRESEHIAIIGGSGAGKTSLLRVVAGLETKSGGNLARDSAARIGYLFQEGNDIPWLTIDKTFKFLLSGNYNRKRVSELLCALSFRPEDVERILGMYPRELSGGERRRISLAFVIANEPDLILLDEPTTNLDMIAKKKVRNAVKGLRTSVPNLSTILVTHDCHDAIELAETIYFMRGGELVDQVFVDDSWRQPDQIGKQLVILEEKVMAVLGD